MNGTNARRRGTVFLILLASLGLATCGKTSTSSTTASVPQTAMALLQYTSSGMPDTSFGGGGIVVTDVNPSEFDFAVAVALQGTQILVAGGAVQGTQGVIALARYNADGSLDTNFGSGGIVRTAVPSVDAAGSAIAVQPGTLPVDDKILVAGSTFDPSTGITGIVLARYNSGGSLDTLFGTGGVVNAAIGPGTDTDTVSLALQGANIVVAGATSDGNFVLRRYDSSGTLDLNFGTNGTTTTNVGASAMSPAIALQSSGKIVAAGASGSFASPPINAVLARYSVDGVLDTTFGGVGGTGIVFADTVPSSNNFANAIVVQPADDNIVVAGHAFVDLTANTSDIALLRYNANGAPDTGFGTNGAVVTDLGAFDNAFSVALQPTGEILVSGSTGFGGMTRVALLRYTAAGVLDSSSFGTGGIVTTSAIGPSTIASGNVVALLPGGGIVVAGYD